MMKTIDVAEQVPVKKQVPDNAPSTTGENSGRGRGNNPQKPKRKS